MIRLEKIEPWSDENGNRVIGSAKGDGKIEFRGSNCTVNIGENVSVFGLLSMDCDGGVLEIGDNSVYKGGIRVGLDSRVTIGQGLSVTFNCFISAAEGASVSIGDDCMFETRNQIRADDAHPIFDRETGARLNLSKDIIIGDHVWLAYESVVFGGAIIGSGAVIGTRALVTRKIDQNTVAVGTPARPVRSNVVWERSHLTLTPPYDFPFRTSADEIPSEAPNSEGTSSISRSPILGRRKKRSPTRS